MNIFGYPVREQKSNDFVDRNIQFGDFSSYLQITLGGYPVMESQYMTKTIRHRVTRIFATPRKNGKRAKYYFSRTRTIPDPDLLFVGGTFVGHPSTVRLLKLKIANKN